MLVIIGVEAVAAIVVDVFIVDAAVVVYILMIF